MSFLYSQEALIDVEASTFRDHMTQESQHLQWLSGPLSTGVRAGVSAPYP